MGEEGVETVGSVAIGKGGLKTGGLAEGKEGLPEGTRGFEEVGEEGIEVKTGFMRGGREGVEEKAGGLDGVGKGGLVEGGRVGLGVVCSLATNLRRLEEEGENNFVLDLVGDKVRSEVKCCTSAKKPVCADKLEEDENDAAFPRELMSSLNKKLAGGKRREC